MLRDPLGFVWRYALGWETALQEVQPLELDARAFGDLVHDILKVTVDGLEPEPGYSGAAVHEIEAALADAVAVIEVQWPATRTTPPQLLWQHTLAAGSGLALGALMLGRSFQPGSRSWTELPFGQAQIPNPPLSLPWEARTEVRIPGTAVRIRGRIDRLDLNAAETTVRVNDYRTGKEPPKADQIRLAGGKEIQRVLYALAVRQLRPDIQDIVARLIFLGGDTPTRYQLDGVDAAITETASYVAAAYKLLDCGHALPGPDAKESWTDRRLALPAALETYFETKRAAFGKAFGDFSRVWRCP
jgi:RecB family exonuclease